jgi:hypothetical protein
MGVADDDRVPVRFAAAGEAPHPPGAALLFEGEAGEAGRDRAVATFSVPLATAHVFGCACCLPRGPVAAALSRLFLLRARGEVAFFDAVVAVIRTPAGDAAVRDALDRDVVTRARFRVG